MNSKSIDDLRLFYLPYYIYKSIIKYLDFLSGKHPNVVKSWTNTGSVSPTHVYDTLASNQWTVESLRTNVEKLSDGEATDKLRDILDQFDEDSDQSELSSIVALRDEREKLLLKIRLLSQNNAEMCDGGVSNSVPLFTSYSRSYSPIHCREEDPDMTEFG